MPALSFLDRAYNSFLSVKVRAGAERSILAIAILGFLVHLTLIILADFGVFTLGAGSKMLSNPIVATYTPFSFIIVYEVYMLVYYLPRSITTYISKQYEIITLIIIRRLFKDLGNLEITSNWFDISGDLQFTYDLIASLVLFYLLYLFVLKGKQAVPVKSEVWPQPANLARFIRFKKGLAVLLIPVLLGLALYTFVTWSIDNFSPATSAPLAFKNINSIFFDQFFTILIVVDVILLLFSFFLTKRFHTVIRNSGFIVSTILIRLSFSTEGLVNVVLIVSSVLFGLLILTVHNLYQKMPEIFDDEERES
ncbi:MAG: hypothetical protein CK538_08380 [Opitutia bacterium]|nr:hypothetical protein [Opitutaceae bacterium]PHX85128.1 MAG: hypothetical protein CK538_08380 [Opitutae bacterium]